MLGPTDGNRKELWNGNRCIQVKSNENARNRETATDHLVSQELETGC